MEPVAEMRAKAAANFEIAASLDDWFQPDMVQLVDGDASSLPVADESIDLAVQDCLFDIFTGRTAFDIGDEASFDDGKGHLLLRDVPLAVCDKTAAAMERLGRADLVVTPSTWHYAGGGCCSPRGFRRFGAPHRRMLGLAAGRPRPELSGEEVCMYAQPPDLAVPETLASEPGVAPEGAVHLTSFPAPARWSTQGQWGSLDWSELRTRVASPELWPGGGGIQHAEDLLPGWAFARYRHDSRVPGPGEPPEESEAERVEEVWGLVVEYVDDVTLDRREVERRWGKWRFLAHTTAFHGSEHDEHPAGPRWRVILPLAQSISAEEGRELGEWAMHPRRRAGQVDACTGEPGRWVTLPALAPGGYEWTEGTGAWLDPAACRAELHAWQEADRHDRARSMLAGSSVEELLARVGGRAEGALPWPRGFDPGLPLVPGGVLAVVSDVPGLRRTFGLMLARAAAEQGRPVLCVATSSTVEENLARLVGLADPERSWRTLADGQHDALELAPLVHALSARAPHLHLLAPGPEARHVSILADEWRALLEATDISGLFLVEDPVDLCEDGCDLRRAVGLPLRDVATWRTEGGAQAVVVLVTSTATARALPLDLVVQVERERIVVTDSDGTARAVGVALDARTGALRRGAPRLQ